MYLYFFFTWPGFAQENIISFRQPKHTRSVGYNYIKIPTLIAGVEDLRTHPLDYHSVKLYTFYNLKEIHSFLECYWKFKKNQLFKSVMSKLFCIISFLLCCFKNEVNTTVTSKIVKLKCLLSYSVCHDRIILFLKMSKSI